MFVLEVSNKKKHQLSYTCLKMHFPWVYEIKKAKHRYVCVLSLHNSEKEDEECCVETIRTEEPVINVQQRAPEYFMTTFNAHILWCS